MKQASNYTASVFCGNCQWNGGISIKCGTEVSQSSCPNCGCATLKPSAKFYWTLDVVKPKHIPQEYGPVRIDW